MDSVQPVFVGLDYHTSFIQVSVVDASGKQLVNRRCGNSVEQVVAAVGRVPARAAVESCCGAADIAERLRDLAAWPISLAHPGYVSRMKLNPDKTDYSDALMLAELCRVGMVPNVWLAPKNIRELRLLVRLREDLVARRKSIKTRILAVLRVRRIDEKAAEAKRWTKKWTAWLKACEELDFDARFVVETHQEELKEITARITSVEKRLEERTKDDAVVRKLLEIKGIGKVTAWAMRALIGRFDRFASGKHLARFCAVTPRNASSGKRMADGGLIKAGDPLLKTVLIEAAHRLKRHDPRWKAFAQSLKARGKPGSVIAAAVANRWVRKLYHELKEVTAETGANPAGETEVGKTGAGAEAGERGVHGAAAPMAAPMAAPIVTKARKKTAAAPVAEEVSMAA